MNKYELALVVTAKIEDDARAEVVEKAKAYITRFAGVITNVEDWGKKRLAYEIQDQREAFYYFIHFEAEPSAPAQIEADLRIMDNVLRYLIVRKDEEDEVVAPEAEKVEETVEEVPAAEQEQE